MSGNRFTQKLLHSAIEASGNSNDVSSDGDREWLKMAIKNITNEDTTLVRRLKECIQILVASKNNNLISDIDIVQTLDEISVICEDIDLACDLHKLGGFSPVIIYLDHANPCIRCHAASVIAVVSQNNPYCQNALLNESQVISKLLDMTETKDTEVELERQVAVKSVHALSCIVRQNHVAFNEFIARQGLSYLAKGLQSKIHKVQLKYLFLLQNLCQENKGCHRLITDMGFAELLVDILHKTTHEDTIEYSLKALICITSNHKGFQDNCKRLNIEEICVKLRKNESMCEKRPEILKYCEELKEIFQFVDG